MSDKYLEAAENLLEDSDECRQLVWDIIEAWVGDRELYEKKPYPYLGCEQCKQTGCPDCFDLVRVSVTEDEPT